MGDPMIVELDPKDLYIGDLYAECTPRYAQSMMKYDEALRISVHPYQEAEIFSPKAIGPEKIVGVKERREFNP